MVEIPTVAVESENPREWLIGLGLRSLLESALIGAVAGAAVNDAGKERPSTGLTSLVIAVVGFEGWKLAVEAEKADNGIKGINGVTVATAEPSGVDCAE